MPLRKYIRRNMYRWHRIASLVIALPVLLWAISGFMHPLMTNIRPQVATQRLMTPVVDTSKIKVPLSQALARNHVDSFSQFRLVVMNDNWFYQVKLPGSAVLKYYSTDNGKLLPQGDELYARYLARQFLEGDEQAAREERSHRQLASLQPAPLPGGSPSEASRAINGEGEDCCSNTMAAILNHSKGAKVSGVEFIEQFDKEYKYVNRYLPAWKVRFARADGIRVYVETGQDRFAFAVDDRRAAFDTFFALFHTWSWLEFLGKGKLVVEIVLLLLAMFTTVMGLYMFFTTKTKKPNGNATARARRVHRYTSVTASLFTLFFTFSGAFHTFEKFKPDTRDQYFADNRFAAAQATPDWPRLYAAIGDRKLITNLSLVKMADGLYWQVFQKGTKPAENPGTAGGKDLMKRRQVPPPNTLYVRTANYTLHPPGEEQYARYLATLFSGRDTGRILGISAITKFEGEYGFVNKRLPVWKVGYAENSRERYYVETSSGKLAALVNDKDLAEGYSFALLHKHHFMDWGGKLTRDISTMFWAAMQVLMVSVGLWFGVKSRKGR